MNIFSEYTIKIKDLVNKLNSDNILELPDNLDGINIDIPPKGFTGDISCNVALVLSKSNKKKPLDIANLISIEIKKNFSEIEDISIVKPGFLNLKFKNSFWNFFLKEIIRVKNNYGSNIKENKKNI